MPRLAGFVGWYTHLPGGREYLMRVPGVARSQLDDARLAAVLNWMLANLSAEQMAPGFPAFTAEEVGRARRLPLQGRAEKRAELLAEAAWAWADRAGRGCDGRVAGAQDRF